MMKTISNNYLFIVLTILFGYSGVVGAIPIRDISNLESITFWERTGGIGPSAFTFGTASSQLITQLSDPLSSSNNDITGVPGAEFYDVFYSNADGSLNLDGEYLTIEGTYSNPLPAGGGLNIAEFSLNFSSSPIEFGNFVASFSALGDNAIPGSVGNAIDGDLLTHTTMGNTVGQTDRLRLTLGFLSSSGPPPTPTPEPGSLALLGLGIVSIGLARRCRKSYNRGQDTNV